MEANEKQECCSICKEKSSSLERMNVTQIMDLLKSIIAKLNSKLLEESLICPICLSKLREAYKFKVSYSETTQKTSFSTAKDNPSVEECNNCEICKKFFGPNDCIPLFDSVTETGLSLMKYFSSELGSKTYKDFFTCEVCQKSLIKFYNFTNVLSIYDQDHIDQVYKLDKGNIKEEPEKMEDYYNSNVHETFIFESKEMSDISEAIKDEIEKSYLKDEAVEFKMEKKETIEVVSDTSGTMERTSGNKIKERKTDRRYRQLSIDVKENILKEVSAGKNIPEVATKFGITRQAIYYLVKKKEAITARKQILQEQEVVTNNPRINGVEETLLEKCVWQWCLQRRESGEPISGPLIREKAKMFNENLGGPATFKASDGWLSKFKKRHGMRSLKMKGEKLSSDKAAAEKFIEWLEKFVTQEKYNWKNIYNADETGLAWKAMPTNTLVMRSEKEAPGYKLPKDRLTVMVCTNATGSHKLPLHVIGKSKKPRCFKNVHELPVIYSTQPSAWMDRGIFKTWYSEVFLPEVHKNKKDKNDKFLLILDNAPSHPDCKELNAIDPSCQVVYLPKNVTALVQPMDQGVIETLKNEYAKRFLRGILYASEQGLEKKEFLKSWNVLECCRLLSSAWNCVGEEGIKNAWHKIGSNFDTPETTRITNTQNLVRLANLISTEEQFSEENITHWLNADNSCPNFRILTDTEIVQYAGNYNQLYESVQDENVDMDPNTEDSRTSPDFAQGSKTTTIEEARDACKILQNWLSSQSSSKKEHFELIDAIDDFILETWVSNKVDALLMCE